MAADPYRYFRVEARELLEQLGKGALDLERSAAPGDLVAGLLRHAHTLKGAARIVKQREIADQTHAIEDELAPYRGATAPLPAARIEAILALIDGIAARVAALTPPGAAEPTGSGRQQPDESFRTVRAEIADMDELLDALAEAHTQVGALRRSREAIGRAGQLAELLASQLARPGGGRDGGNGVVLDRVRSLADELSGSIAAAGRGLANGVEQVDRELRQARDGAERLRLIPAVSLFTSLERVARDAAQVQGKRVVFEGRGGDVRLDAHVLGAVQGALLQLVRNAVAHGIEPPAERTARGKPAEGRVLLDVARRGRRVAFTCRDDGRGLDLEAVKRAALRKGMRSADAERMTPEQLIGLLLGGGITTSGTVTELSGRGIGLDVVRESTERLGGEVTVHSDPGVGTVVEMVVPLSLASLEGLQVEAGGLSATLPLDAVRRSAWLAADQIVQTADGEAIAHDGRLIPFIPLARLLSPRPVPRTTRAWSVVVIEGSGGQAALGVDRLLGTAAVVLRPLPELAPATEVIAGASLDAEGNPHLVLDPDGVIAEAGRRVGAAPEPAVAAPRILVIDDSLTTRMLEQSILESAGYQVDLAVSGDEALDRARTQPYALFLVDVEMPGIDGFTFIERARADAALRDIPAVLVTSRASAEDRLRGQQVGARGYIVKSEFDQEELLRHIAELVG